MHLFLLHTIASLPQNHDYSLPSLNFRFFNLHALSHAMSTVLTAVHGSTSQLPSLGSACLQLGQPMFSVGPGLNNFTESSYITTLLLHY